MIYKFELRSVSAYHFWSRLGTLVHVSLCWYEAKVCNHSLPMPSPCWWITVKEGGSQDPKENPLLQDTTGTRDSLRLMRAEGSPGWRQSLSHHSSHAQGKGRWGQPGGWHRVLWCGQVEEWLGRTHRADSALWTLTLIQSVKLSWNSAAFFSFNEHHSEVQELEKSHCAAQNYNS